MKYVKTGKLIVLVVVLAVCLAGHVANADIAWTAYNDTHSGGAPGSNITDWTIHNNDQSHNFGKLKDYETGSDVGMPSVLFTMGAAGLNVSTGAGADPAPGTDAYEIFNNIVQLSGYLVYYGNPGWWMEIEFTGLNPTRMYSFVGTSIRDSDYPLRKSLFTIMGHVSAINNSSDGVLSKTDNTTIMLAGDNDVRGYIVRWDDIIPAVDGSFKIRSEATADSDAGKAYPISAFRLQEIGGMINRPPSVNAGNDQEITLPVHSIALNATVTDDGLGDPNGYLAYQWSKVGGPGGVTFEPNGFVEDPNAHFPLNKPGVYVLRLDATDGELSDFDEVSITVHAPECPLGDLNGDCVTDFNDLEILGSQWLVNPAGNADLSGDGHVDFNDYMWLAGSWQENWQKSSLRVFIYPEEARGDGAQWRVDGGTWHNHGDIEQDLSIGIHTVEFRSIMDWYKPNDVDVDVVYDQLFETSGTYIQHTGSLRVDISPADVLPDAKWRRVGESQWRDSDTTETDVPVGPHNVEFSVVSGSLSPGIREVFVEQNTLCVLNAAYTLWADITLRINEFMAMNTSHSGITDEHGDYDDWIEIYNTTDSPIDMGGMYIADAQNIWQIPTGYPGQTTVDAKDYLLLWADDEEETEGPLHLAFELDADGDEITLYDTDGTTVIDRVVFDSQLANVSYGRYPDGSNNLYYFTDPTEGVYNDQAGIANKVADTEFTPDRGFYTSPFYVTITTDTPGATIYYTTDCTWPIDENGNPTATAQEYNGSTNKPYITTTTNLRAAAVKSGNLPTNIDTQTYIFLDDVLQQPTNPAGYPSQWISGGNVITGDYQVDPDIVNHTNAENRLTTDDMQAVPTIVVSMPINDWFQSGHGLYVTEALDGTEYPCSFEYIDPNVGGLVLQQNCAMSMQGGISGGGTSLNRWKTPKLSNRPRFKTQTDDGTLTGGPPKLRARIFPDSPVQNFDTVVLDAVLNHSWHHSDLSQRNTAKYIQDQGVADYHNAMLPGHSPHGSYVHMYINTLYWGMYYLHERPDHSWAAETFGGKKEEYDAIKHNSGNVINNGVGGAGASANFSTMEGAASTAEADPSNLAKWQTLEQHLDVDNLITYLLAHWFAGIHDWPGKNWYATHRVGGQWRFHTWDAEHSFEAYNNTGQSPEGVHARLDGHPEYKIRWADHIHKYFHHNGPLDDYPRCFELYKARVTQVNEAIRGESARWGDCRRNPPHNRLEWLGVNTQDGSYFTNRSSNVFGYLSGLYPNTDPPDFEINGSPMYGGYAFSGDNLTITNPNGSGMIYYTLNGNDPRAFGGAVNTSGGALAYGSVIPLTHSLRVKARVLNSGEWSALSDAVFAVGPVAENLRITEIMYHPRNAGALTDPNEEFIELKNTGTSTLNLNLVKFTEGIHFTFPDIELDPEECVVVVEDQSAFESKYGTSVNTAGQYIGSLDNNGERIKLVDAVGKTILDFEYKEGWYPITDGDGFSLTIIKPGDSAVYSSEGLFAHWKLDDGTGNTATDSAGSNNGALIGNPTWTAGPIDGALSFDGVDDYVVAAPVAPLASDTFSVQAWIRTDESAGLIIPFLTQNRVSDSGGFYFYIYNDKPDVYVYGSSGSARANSPEALNTNQWYRVAATNDGSNLKLYVDGRLKDSDSSTGLMGVNENANIGYDPVTSTYYTGLIDDVRIYNRAMSESEFQDIAEPMGRWSQKYSWRASVYRNGSPGWDDSDILPNPGAVVINEVMAHSNTGPDWIELYNTTEEAINISGWYLSDNDKSEPNLMKYRIADGTTIDVNDYLVFYEDANFSNPNDPGCNVPFVLSENGEKACLSSGLDPNGFLTGYRDVENFGASQTNVSFGRYYKSSTGNFNFVAMDYNTPDANNAYPKVGPVVINEIMYNPPSGNQDEEYIELHNITGGLVTLYRYDKSTPWKFTDGIDYTFSSGPVVTIQAYGYLILAKDLTAFTMRYGGMPSGVQVLDGYIGRLSNAGERLQIAMPGDIDEFGTRQYIRIDRVTYSDGLHPEDCPGGVDHWPIEADGLGKSLSRKVSSDYGNDVANWEAATPSPGVANP